MLVRANLDSKGLSAGMMPLALARSIETNLVLVPFTAIQDKTSCNPIRLLLCVAFRNRFSKMHDPEIPREILNAFWKIHILYHAAKEPISGNLMLKELREHGYEIRPGTLYPLLKPMSERNWLKEVSLER
jgi:hypothetical protein